MGKRFFWVTCVLLSASFVIIGSSSFGKAKPTAMGKSEVAAALKSGSTVQLFNNYVNNIYQSAHLAKSGMNSAVFLKALVGFYNLKLANKTSANCSVITIVDLAKSSCSKRMWIVDIKKMHILLNTWVAHGSGSGGDIPNQFSNKENSFQSSLGFYVTGKVYDGSHGVSLTLEGLDEGFNNMAYKRAIVMHGAAYVSQQSINEIGRLGRSEGCPAVATNVIEKVVHMIKGQTPIFINGKNRAYKSKYLDRQLAASLALGIINGHAQAIAML